MITSGLLFGFSCVVTIYASIAFMADVIFDARSVVRSVAALFGGPLVAVIAGSIAGAWRLYIGGAGALVGVYSILSSVLIGLAMALTLHSKKSDGARVVRMTALLSMSVWICLKEMRLSGSSPWVE